LFVFFFQAEDGIRDRNVTGVQTCALPISNPHLRLRAPMSLSAGSSANSLDTDRFHHAMLDGTVAPDLIRQLRSAAGPRRHPRDRVPLLPRPRERARVSIAHGRDGPCAPLLGDTAQPPLAC